MENKDGNQDPTAQDPKHGNQDPTAQDPKIKGDGQGVDENIKALQRKISEKDIEVKRLQQEIEDSKNSSSTLISELNKKLNSVTGFVDDLKKEKELGELKEKYPDISSELLINVSEEKREEVAKSQREMNKKQFGDSKYFQAPEYSSIQEIEERIEAIDKDASLSAEDSAMEKMKLERLKRNFS